MEIETITELEVEPGWSLEAEPNNGGDQPLVATELERRIGHYQKSVGFDDELTREFGANKSELFTAFLRGSRRGRVVKSRYRDFERVPVIQAGSPSAVDSSVTTSWASKAAGSTGLSITLGPLTGGAAAKYAVAASDKVSVTGGQTQRGHLVLPVWKEVRMVVPPGGYEEFPVVDYWPDPEREIGFEAKLFDGQSILVDPLASPLSSDTTLQGDRSETVEQTISVALELSTEDSTFNFGATAELAWSATVKVAWKLPAGSYKIASLDDPPGWIVR